MATAHTRDDHKDNHKTRRAKDEREISEMEPGELEVGIEPLAASVYTVTTANPTPPTNIPYVAYGTPPMAGMVPAQNLRDPAWVPGTAFTALMKPTYSADCALVPTGGQLPNPPVGGQSTIPAAAVATTAIATPVGGSGGTGVVGGSPAQTTGVILVTATVAEASGAIVVVTAPGSRTEAPTQAVIQNPPAWSFTPNASAPSAASQIYTLSPQNLTAAAGNSALTVTGRGFNSGSVVSVATIAQTTVFVSSTVLTVAAAPKKATPGNQAVIVTTDGVASAVVNWVFV